MLLLFCCVTSLSVDAADLYLSTKKLRLRSCNSTWWFFSFMLTYVSLMTEDRLLSPTSRLFLQHGLCSLLYKSLLFFLWINNMWQLGNLFCILLSSEAVRFIYFWCFFFDRIYFFTTLRNNWHLFIGVNLIIWIYFSSDCSLNVELMFV